MQGMSEIHEPVTLFNIEICSHLVENRPFQLKEITSLRLGIGSDYVQYQPFLVFPLCNAGVPVFDLSFYRAPIGFKIKILSKMSVKCVDASK